MSLHFHNFHWIPKKQFFNEFFLYQNQDEEDEDQLHFKQRPSSVEQKSNYEYTSGNPDVGYGLVDGRSSVSSTKDEQLLLKDISMLREDRVKREKY